MKTATQWKTQSGTDTVTSQSDFSLLLEDGFNLLLEDGGELILESSIVTPKSPTEWNVTDKVRTAWEARDGYSTPLLGVSTTRITEQGTSRITEQGTARATEDSEFSQKNPTEWNEL